PDPVAADVGGQVGHLGGGGHPPQASALAVPVGAGPARPRAAGHQQGRQAGRHQPDPSTTHGASSPVAAVPTILPLLAMILITEFQPQRSQSPRSSRRWSVTVKPVRVATASSSEARLASTSGGTGSSSIRPQRLHTRGWGGPASSPTSSSR